MTKHRLSLSEHPWLPLHTLLLHQSKYGGQSMSIEVPCLYWVYLTFTVGIVIVKAMRCDADFGGVLAGILVLGLMPD